MSAGGSGGLPRAARLGPVLVGATFLTGGGQTARAEPLREAGDLPPAPQATFARAELPLPDFAASRRDAPAPGGAALMPPTAQRTFPEAPVAAGPQARGEARGEAPVLSYDDEMILAIRVAGAALDDTVIAYGSGDGAGGGAGDALYLPLGAIARFLDLAVAVSDDGHYAGGWFLSEDRRLAINLRAGTAEVEGRQVVLAPADAVAFDGEMYVRAERFADLFPLSVTPDLRDQSIAIATREPFPFEARLARETERTRLGNQQASQAGERFAREETPWLPLSVPMGDVEARAVSDSTFGERVETDLRLAGDLAWMTAQVFLSSSTRDGLTSAHVELGRADPDGDLLGPLRATAFTLGDTATSALPMGLRGVAGRGATLTNAPIEAASVFDRIDLRGQLPTGYEVELYRNGVLSGSTRQAVNGQYEFLQVPLDYGLNLVRLVFYGPQGQRYEEVRHISVGDGRLAKGQLVYALGAAEKDRNLLGVTPPRFVPGLDYGRWRASAQLTYGLTQALTVTTSGGWFDSDRGARWLAGGGLRTGIGGLALKLDIAAQDRAGGSGSGGYGAGRAIELGLGGRMLGASYTILHAEYRGDFVDEVRVFDGRALRRVTEINANATLRPGGERGLQVPIYARARRIEYAQGDVQTSASLRASARVSGLLASNTLEFSRFESSTGGGATQLVGSFDLATLNGSRTQVRASANYTLVPGPRLDAVALEVDRAIDDRTLVRATLARSFHKPDTQFGLSAERRFERFTLAFDGSYGVRDKVHALSLRLGFGFGRNPASGRLYVAAPGAALSGAVAVRAYEDVDGDGRFGVPDKVIPEVAFGAGTASGTTGADGTVLLTGLGSGARASIQVDPTSLPDIALAPAERGFEIVPRPGRVHRRDFAIVAMSEVEGTARFMADGRSRGVSGLQLRLVDSAGKVAATTRSEADGFYLFEQVRPGRYSLDIDPDQMARLRIAHGEAIAVEVGPRGGTLSRDISVVQR